MLSNFIQTGLEIDLTAIDIFLYAWFLYGIKSVWFDYKHNSGCSIFKYNKFYLFNT